MYACDSRWYRHWIGTLTADFEGILWTQDVQWDGTDPAQWGIRKLTSVNKPGFSTEWPIIHQGCNSGYQAVNLAGHLLKWDGRVILLGYDMKKRGEQRHWFGAHPDGMEVESNYANWCNLFQSTVPTEQYGIEVWNCTRDTALHCYPWYDLDEVIEKLDGADTEEVQRDGDCLRDGAEHQPGADRGGQFVGPAGVLRQQSA